MIRATPGQQAEIIRLLAEMNPRTEEKDIFWSAVQAWRLWWENEEEYLADDLIYVLKMGNWRRP